jgi:tetratricopeptide (TPR) repeat protein
MTRTTLSWIAALLMMSGAQARADAPREPLPAAKVFLDAGVAAYSAGDYEAAAREFSAAYKIDPQPAMLYAWAQSLRLGNRCSDAIAIYRRYLAADLTEAQIAAAQNGISLCEKAAQPEPAPEEPAPEEPEEPEQPEQPEEPEPAPPAAGPPIDAPPTRPWYANRLGGALAIGGAVSLGVGVGFLVRSSQNRDAAGDAVFREDFVELLDTATLQRRIGVVGLGVGAALVAGGVLRYMTERERSRSVSVAIAGRSFVVSGRF